MPGQLLKSFCAALAVMLAACVPFITFVDYVPVMQGGMSATDNCAGYHRVKYEHDGVSLTSRILQVAPNQPTRVALGVFITVPEGHTVTLLSADVAVKTTATEGTKAGRTKITKQRKPIGIIATQEGKYFGAKPGQLESTVMMEGRDTEFRGRKFPREFSFQVSLDQNAESDFEVELPNMLINGKIVNIPPILFKRTQRVEFMAALNC